MTAVQSTMRHWILWLVPLGLLVLLLAWQTDWGRALTRVPPAPVAIAAKPLAVAVLPEYRAVATTENSRDFIDRSLFNPTRRPAPAAAVESAKQARMQRGQFALTGTLVTDGRATALLRETAGGKSRRIAQGETINGMVVSEVKADRVRLTLGDESEELSLKLAVGPKTTVQPAVVAVTPRPAGGAAGAPVAAAAPGAPPVRDVGEVLAERRRAARDAENAARAANRAEPGNAGAPPQPVPAPAAAGAPVDPQWQSVFQRYQQPRR